MYVVGQPDGITGLSAIAIVPNTIIADVEIIYIRYPSDPIWAYVSLINGEPMQDAAVSVNFEVAEQEESILVNKILEKAGISIREPDVYRTAQENDTK